MRMLICCTVLFAFALQLSAQSTHESQIGFTSLEIGLFNRSLENSGVKTNIRSLSVWGVVDTSGTKTRFGRVRGEIEINCANPARKVDVARIKFVMTGKSELSGHLADSLRAEGLVLADPNAVMAMMSNRLDGRDLFLQTLRLGIKACNTPAGSTNYLALSVWGENDNSRVMGLVPPVLTYQVLDAKRYAELTKL